MGRKRASSASQAQPQTRKKRKCGEERGGEDSVRIKKLAVGGEEETGENEGLTRALSDDNILHILRHLPTRFLLTSPALVCRRWHRLCCSHLVLELAPSPLSSYKPPWGSLGEKDVLDLARLHSTTLETLKLYGLGNLKSDEIVSLVRLLPKLTDFALVPSHLIGSGLEDVLRSLPRLLSSLDLHYDHLLSGHCEDITDRPVLTCCIQIIQENFPELQNLNLDCCSDISIKCLNSLLLTFPKLRTLHLNSDTFGWPEVRQILQICTRLESLSLVSARFQEESSSDDEDEVPMFGRRGLHSRRQTLNTSGPADLSFRSVLPASLYSLRLYSSPHRSVPLDSSPLFGLLKEKGQQLHHLHAQSLHNTSWHTISVWCANLRTLDLSHARSKAYITTGIEEVILSGLPQLLRSLERVGLPSVTDRVLIELGKFCPKLKEIHFEGHGAAGYWIQNHHRVTDRGVIALAEGCPNLQVISLAGCMAVSMSSLRILAFHCRNLKILLLPGCKKINDDVIATIWPRFSTCLLVLDVTGCKITLKSVKHIYDDAQIHGTSLSVLTVSRSLWKSINTELPNLHRGRCSFRISHDPVAWDGLYGSQI